MREVHDVVFKVEPDLAAAFGNHEFDFIPVFTTNGHLQASVKQEEELKSALLSFNVCFAVFIFDSLV